MRYKGSEVYVTRVILTLVLVTVFQLVQPVGRVSATGHSAEQATALQLAFRHHLSSISDIPYYHIDATVDLENARVDGRLSLHYSNTTQGSLSELVFRLLPNAKTIYGNGSLSVDAVTQGSKALDFELSADQTVMRVPLSRPLAPGQSVSLDLTFVTELPINDYGGYGILNHTSRITSLAGWYPILAVYRDGWQTLTIPRVGDAMVAETSLYEVALTLPNEASVVSTGIVTRLERDASTTVWHLVSGPAREFAVAVSQDFEQHQAQVQGVTVRFHALPAANPRTSAETALATVTEAFKVFVEQFGPYPFTEFDVVEAPISIGGYEFPGMVYVDDRLRTHGAPADYRYIVAHEVAHQWWYGLVGNDSITEPWLDESLASYSAAIYLEQTQGKAAKDALLSYWRRTYGLRTAQGPVIDSSALDFSSWVTYRSPVYYQGALFLDTLREEMGDEAFFLLIKRHLASYRYRSATTEDFLRLAEAVACRDLDGLFEQWFDVDDDADAVSCRLWSPDHLIPYTLG